MVAAMDGGGCCCSCGLREAAAVNAAATANGTVPSRSGARSTPAPAAWASSSPPTTGGHASSWVLLEFLLFLGCRWCLLLSVPTRLACPVYCALDTGFLRIGCRWRLCCPRPFVWLVPYCNDDASRRYSEWRGAFLALLPSFYREFHEI